MSLCSFSQLHVVIELQLCDSLLRSVAEIMDLCSVLFDDCIKLNLPLAVKLIRKTGSCLSMFEPCYSDSLTIEKERKFVPIFRMAIYCVSLVHLGPCRAKALTSTLKNRTALFGDPITITRRLIIRASATPSLLPCLEVIFVLNILIEVFFLLALGVGIDV